LFTLFQVVEGVKGILKRLDVGIREHLDEQLGIYKVVDGIVDHQ
jgi:hypothetical protein